MTNLTHASDLSNLRATYVEAVVHLCTEAAREAATLAAAGAKLGRLTHNHSAELRKGMQVLVWERGECVRARDGKALVMWAPALRSIDLVSQAESYVEVIV